MNDMTSEERETVTQWAQKNDGKINEATVYWTFLESLNGIESAIKLSDEFIEELDDLEQAWYDTREALGRRCLEAMNKAGQDLTE